jgi:acylglycerol lipase
MNEYFINSIHGKINIIEGNNITNSKGIILHVHGVGSHFQFVYSNLDDLITRNNFFSKFGYGSIGFEFFGHGKSEGLNCSIENFDDLICDLINVVTHINTKYPNKNIFICAESMGGAVVLKYIIDSAQSSNVKGIILLSPLCGIDEHLKPKPYMINILMGISMIFPNIQLALTTKKMNYESTSNYEFIEAKKINPYDFKPPHRLCTVRELFNISSWIPKNANKITIPMILFHGLRDKLTTPSGSIEVFEKISSSDKEIVLLPESDHCILIPSSHDDLTPNYVYVKILSWLESRFYTISNHC